VLCRVLRPRIKEIHIASLATFSAPRIHVELAGQGYVWAVSAWPA
jgi:hypothetical protein